MDGAMVVEGGDIYDFIELCSANLGWNSGHWIKASARHH
jgi:cyclopropane-fatty-acyl-phospholipid synthase